MTDPAMVAAVATPSGSGVKTMIFCGRRRAVILLLAMASAGSAAAQQPTAEVFLASIYKPYLARDFMGQPFYDQPDRFFVPDLADALRRDEDRNRGMVGTLDFDPFICAQAFEITNLSISVTTEGARTTGQVAFDNLGRPMRIAIDLAQTPAGWRIADIKWLDGVYRSRTLRALFKLR